MTLHPATIIPVDRDEAARDQPQDFVRPLARGKFFFIGERKLWVKGVTYGPFKPNNDQEFFPEIDVVSQDFAAMASAGINTVRTYTPPPQWLLDVARSNGLWVIVGLAWEQHVAFLQDKEQMCRISDQIRLAVRKSQNHPAILSFAIGNEIPSGIVRWHGKEKIEKFIKRLYRSVKKEAPDILVTYVNYPTTEYLQLPFLDFQCFNIYLENQEELEAYLPRLQNLAWDKPLLIGELGLDGKRNGEEKQASELSAQIQTVFSAGCAGTVVFSWTDEWFRGGVDITDWEFGLTRRNREPKQALTAVIDAFVNTPFSQDFKWPEITVIVCSYNGARTIRQTLDGCVDLDYPWYHVIVVDDGSTDDTAAICAEYDFELIRTENSGLSNARNTGLHHSKGEIVAYIDDDAFPDRDWLKYLALMFQTNSHAAVGGQSLAPPGYGPVADCVAGAPGRPVHVLLTDHEAEHIPGCNMAFRKKELLEIGGFDPRYRAAGDDVDVCWRILEQGWSIGFQASAVNWHLCRNSVKAYWNQQKGYGKAEALLESKWPGKYNAAGHHNWRGRIYTTNSNSPVSPRRSVIYQGQWGSAPFQSLYAPTTHSLASITLIPEWFFVVGLLAALSVLGLAWKPLLWTVPLLFTAILVPLVQAVISASKVSYPTPAQSVPGRMRRRLCSITLHMLQPMARLFGRYQHGLTPWRKRGGLGSSFEGKCHRQFRLWSEDWRSPGSWLEAVQKVILAENIPLVCGGDFDPWDLEIRGGMLGRAHLLMAAEEHGEGKQQLRFSVKSLISGWVLGLAAFLAGIAILASFDGAYSISLVMVVLAAVLIGRSRVESLMAVKSFCIAIQSLDGLDTEGRS